MRRTILCILVCLSSAALAVSTSHWTQTSETDFDSGTLHNVVATNLGELKLSRALKTLLEQDPKVSMVTALAQGKDGVIYAGTSPQCVLLQISAGKVTPVATIDGGVSITALLPESDGGLLIGVSGSQGRVLRIDKPGVKPREIFSAQDVQYIWGLVKLDDGIIYAATGPNGQLFAIHPDGKQEEIYKSDEDNLSALATDGKNYLYVGTDPDGLVVRIDRNTKESFVMYDADEDEITALALDADGNLYAATGQAPEPQQPQQPAETKDQSGRPQTPAEVPLPSQPPKAPKPPQPPLPNPGEPPPIPKQPRVFLPRPQGGFVVPAMMTTLVDDPQPPDSSPDQPDNPAGGDNASGDNGEKPSVRTPAGNADADQTKPQGNAVYKIDKDGFVTEVFRDQVVIYSMIENKGVLLLGTGNDGQIYQVDPDAQETVVLAKTDAKQVTSLLAASDGQIYLGLSNTGGIAAMTSGYADSGTYTSAVQDATQVSRFGMIHMHGSLPKGTALTLSTRCGNVRDSDSPGWSKWTAEADAEEYLPIGSPPARFLQYRITFKTTDPSVTPIIRDVDVAYQMPHLAPVIKSIKISDAPPATPPQPPPSGNGSKSEEAPKPAGTGSQVITWDASSPNGDALVYSLYFRTAPGGLWILLKSKLTDENFTWDTKNVADGRYEVKVEASDASANPVGDGKTASRVSDVLEVDNTPPVIGDLNTVVSGHSVNINLRVTDQTSTIASMEYSVDSNDVWQAVLPEDKIFDQPDEKVAISIDGLADGAHQISLCAADIHGNMAYQTVTVTVGAK